MMLASSSTPLTTLGGVYTALCADGGRNKLLKPIKASRAMVSLLDGLEAEARRRVEAQREKEAATITSSSSSPLLYSGASSYALFGRCHPSHLPIIGSVARQHIISAAVAAKVPTPSYTTDYCLDASKAYAGPSAVVVLCEALLAYEPTSPSPSAAADGGGGASGANVVASTKSADESRHHHQPIAAHSSSSPLPPLAMVRHMQQSFTTYCNVKELRLASCGLDTTSAYALFRLLTSERFAFTLKVLDVRHNPYLALEAGQLFLGAMGYVVRDADAAGGGSGGEERAGADLVALLRRLGGGGGAEDATIPLLAGGALAMGESHTASVVGGAEVAMAQEEEEALKFRTFDIGTQTSERDLARFRAEAEEAVQAMKRIEAGDVGEEAGEGEESEDPNEDPAVRVERRRALREKQRRESGFRSRPRAPNRTISRLCTISTDGTNIPPHYVRRLEALCEQNRHL